MVVVTSLRWGTFAMREVLLPSSVAARIGSTAFFAPEMRTSPASGALPSISSLSIDPRRAPGRDPATIRPRGRPRRATRREDRPARTPGRASGGDCISPSVRSARPTWQTPASWRRPSGTATKASGRSARRAVASHSISSASPALLLRVTPARSTLVTAPRSISGATVSSARRAVSKSSVPPRWQTSPRCSIVTPVPVDGLAAPSVRASVAVAAPRRPGAVRLRTTWHFASSASRAGPRCRPCGSRWRRPCGSS